jgi:hypothetical protein
MLPSMTLVLVDVDPHKTGKKTNDEQTSMKNKHFPQANHKSLR